MGTISYPLLQSAKSQIRLACLQPGDWTDPLSISLQIFSLHISELPFFEAVSYTWGNQLKDKPINCSEASVYITESAENVLRRLRVAKSSRLLWIDMICINQNDDEEKSSQIQLMGLIYQRASRVLIYLGEADDYSDSVMDAIAQRKPSTSAIQQKVLSFFEERSWFTRVWVLQEVALATCALAICGSKCVPWANFPAWWAQNAASLQDKIPPAALAYNSVAKKSFLQQLHDTRTSRATDPRDKVFALAAMSSLEDRPSINPDYSKAMTELYTEVACEIVKHQISLQILCAVQPISGQSCLKSPDNLPSWVPDWSKKSRLVSLGLSNHYLEPYDAGGSTALAKIEWRQKAYPKLRCLGIRLGIVSATGQICPIDASGDSIAQVLSEWNDLGSQSISSRPRNTKLGQGVFFVAESYFIVHSTSDMIWPTIRALPHPTLELAPDELAKREACPATTESLRFCLGRRLFRTINGLLGLAPPQAIVDDLIVILLGAPVPYVLRRYDDHYKLVGECYTHGVMNGEALASLSEDIALEIPGHRVRPFPEKEYASSLEWFELQ